MLGKLRGVVVAGLAALLLTACQSSPSANLSPTASLGRPALETRDLGAIPVSSQLPVGIPTATVPAGFLAFCIRDRSQCGTSLTAPASIAMNETTWELLNRTNQSVNRSITPLDDKLHYGSHEYWTIPTDGRGDCDDYALTKRKWLMQAGIPERALRITVVTNWRGDRHAVLTIATDRGDYTLDNLRSEILPWLQTGYTYIGRQDPSRPWGWVALNDAFDQRATAGLITR